MKLDMSQQYTLEAKRVNFILDASSTTLTAGPMSCSTLHWYGSSWSPVCILGATILEEHKTNWRRVTEVVKDLEDKT